MVLLFTELDKNLMLGCENELRNGFVVTVCYGTFRFCNSKT